MGCSVCAAACMCRRQQRPVGIDVGGEQLEQRRRSYLVRVRVRVRHLVRLRVRVRHLVRARVRVRHQLEVAPPARVRVS